MQKNGLQAAQKFTRTVRGTHVVPVLERRLWRGLPVDSVCVCGIQPARKVCIYKIRHTLALLRLSLALTSFQDNLIEAPHGRESGIR